MDNCRLSFVEKKRWVVLSFVGTMTLTITLFGTDSSRLLQHITDNDGWKTSNTDLPTYKASADFTHGSNKIEPFCAMYSDENKQLIWPKTPTDSTDWTYKRKRQCPKLSILVGQKDTRRVKYSLSCDGNVAKLVASFTNSSEDFEVVEFPYTCLSTFIKSCCNDNRGIPNIVHYVWYNRREMNVYMFFSMVSVIRFVRPCLILFHGDFLPYGKYWDYIIRIYPKIIHVKRQIPSTIFGKNVKFVEHFGDIMRIEALMKFGGIYFDTDSIALRDLEPLREYNITFIRQAPGLLANHFIMSKRNATFLTLWMDGYKNDYRKENYSYNSMIYNRDLAQKRPDLVHVEEGTLRSPSMLTEESIDPNVVYNWSSLYQFHVYQKMIKLRLEVERIKSYNTTLGAMLRHVIYGNKELCD